jgi:predicted aspartyl protease
LGHVYLEAEFFNPLEPSLKLKTRSLVDIGATYTVLPRKIAEELKLKGLGRVKAKTASKVEWLEGVEVRAHILGRERITPALVSETIDIPLIGVVTMEIFRFKVDPATGRIEELPLLLYLKRV